MDFHFPFWASSWPRDLTCVSCVSCIGRYYCNPWKPCKTAFCNILTTTCNPTADECCLTPSLSCFQGPLSTAEILFGSVWLTTSISRVTCDWNLISPYKNYLLWFIFSSCRNTFRIDTMHSKQSYFLHHCTLDFMHGWIYMFWVFANIEPLFTTNMCIIQFIEQFSHISYSRGHS